MNPHKNVRTSKQNQQDTKSIDKNQLFFPYTKDKQSKKETTKIIIFTKASKRIKYLGILLTKKVKLSY